MNSIYFHDELMHISGVSDRFGNPCHCLGPECMVCGGSGWDGNALVAWIKDQKQEEEQRNPKRFRASQFTHPGYLREEEKYYRGGLKNEAMELAVIAFELALKQQKEWQWNFRQEMKALEESTPSSW